MTDVVIVEAVRSPIGRRNGGLSTMHSLDLLGAVQRDLFIRTGVDPLEVGPPAHGGQSRPDSLREAMRTLCRAATASTRALVTAGSGRAARRSGALRACRRMLAAGPATFSGSERMSLPRADPTGSSGLAAAWCPSSTAITNPRASLAVNTSGGRRSARPRR